MHVEAYVVYINMILDGVVLFKLTQGTIDELVDFHPKTYLADEVSITEMWHGKGATLERRKEEFRLAINRFVFSARLRVLEGLENEHGIGELLEGRSEMVNSCLLQLFRPLIPPLWYIGDVASPASPTVSPPCSGHWWNPTQEVVPPDVPLDFSDAVQIQPCASTVAHTDLQMTFVKRQEHSI